MYEFYVICMHSLVGIQWYKDRYTVSVSTYSVDSILGAGHEKPLTAKPIRMLILAMTALTLRLWVNIGSIENYGRKCQFPSHEVMPLMFAAPATRFTSQDSSCVYFPRREDYTRQYGLLIPLAATLLFTLLFLHLLCLDECFVW